MWFVQDEVLSEVQFWEDLYKHVEIEVKNKATKMLIRDTYLYVSDVVGTVCSFICIAAWETFWDKLEQEWSGSGE